jgi:hypothetical protein
MIEPLEVYEYLVDYIYNIGLTNLQTMYNYTIIAICSTWRVQYQFLSGCTNPYNLQHLKMSILVA